MQWDARSIYVGNCSVAALAVTVTMACEIADESSAMQMFSQPGNPFRCVRTFEF
jgi:hypothetical protein